MAESTPHLRLDAFDAFFEAHYDDVVRALTLVVGDRDRADDAAQEAFAQAFRKWSTVSTMDRPVGWVIVVGVNRLKRWIARGERSRAPGSEPRRGDLARRDVADPADGVAAGTDLRQALDRLGPRQRATVVLRYLCDLSTDDVAKALGCSPGTVKSALHQALVNLRVELDEQREPDESAAADRLLPTAAGHDEEHDDHAS